MNNKRTTLLERYKQHSFERDVQQTNNSTRELNNKLKKWDNVNEEVYS